MGVGKREGIFAGESKAYSGAFALHHLFLGFSRAWLPHWPSTGTLGRSKLPIS